MSAPLSHPGQVRRIVDGQAQIAVLTAGCSSCGHVGGCGIGKLSGGRRETVLALPANDLRVGQTVMLELDETLLTRAALLGYLLPAALLLGGALLGEALATNPAERDAAAALGALLGLFCGLALTRLRRPLTPRIAPAAPLAPLYPLENPHV